LLIKQASALLGLDQRPVRSADDARRAVKFRKGGEAFLPLLSQASERYGVSVPSKPTSSMLDAAAEANELEPLRTAVAQLSTSLDDWYLSDRSEAWAIATTLYSMLKKAALREPKLAELLVPVKEFFAYRHPSVAAQNPKRSDTKAVTQAQTKAQQTATKLKGRIDQIEAVLPAAKDEAAAAPVATPVVAAPAAVRGA
jgi:Tfp pilus assembly protein PilV